MDCSLRIKFYPSKFFNEVISVGIIVQVSECTAARFWSFWSLLAKVLPQHPQTELQQSKWGRTKDLKIDQRVSCGTKDLTLFNAPY